MEGVNLIGSGFEVQRDIVYKIESQFIYYLFINNELRWSVGRKLGRSRSGGN